MQCPYLLSVVKHHAFHTVNIALNTKSHILNKYECPQLKFCFQLLRVGLSK